MPSFTLVLPLQLCPIIVPYFYAESKSRAWCRWWCYTRFKSVTNNAGVYLKQEQTLSSYKLVSSHYIVITMLWKNTLIVVNRTLICERVICVLRLTWSTWSKLKNWKFGSQHQCHQHCKTFRILYRLRSNWKLFLLERRSTRSSDKAHTVFGNISNQKWHS